MKARYVAQFKRLHQLDPDLSKEHAQARIDSIAKAHNIGRAVVRGWAIEAGVLTCQVATPDAKAKAVQRYKELCRSEPQGNYRALAWRAGTEVGGFTADSVLRWAAVAGFTKSKHSVESNYCESGKSIAQPCNSATHARKKRGTLAVAEAQAGARSKIWRAGS